MSDLNFVVLNGRLVKSAELSRWTDGTPYCNFTIGNNETWKNQNGEYESIGSFFDCTMKGAYAETMSKHLLKGRQIIVEGRLKQTRWESDGQKYSRIVVRVANIHLVGPYNIENGNGSNSNSGYGSSTSYGTSQGQSQVDNPAVKALAAAGLTDEYIPFNEDPVNEDIPF